MTRVLCVVVSVSFAVVGACIPRPKIELYNATSSRIAISVGANSYHVEPGGFASFDSRPSEWGRFQICLMDTAYEFEVPPPSGEFFHMGLLRGSLRTQLNPGGTIVVVKPGTEMPVPGDSAQPPGFPLAGSVVGACSMPTKP